MPVAFVLITAGVTLVYSAIRNVSLIDLLAGREGTPIGDQKPPAFTDAGGAPGSGATVASGNDPKGQFKGPNAAVLRALADAATEQFNLRISQVCRPQNASYGAPNSLHKSCRAFDSVGKLSDRIAFARYAAGFKGRGISEVFCDQAGMVAPGYDHSDHVHVGG